MRVNPVFCGGLVLAALSYAGSAAAFCRTTTCDQDREICTLNAAGCLNEGIPLFWPNLCVTFAVHEAGSPLRGISYSATEEASRLAFQTWISADCGGGTHPSIGVVSRGKVYCDRIEYNHDEDEQVAGPNANLIVFRDLLWPYADGNKTIALTTITFATASGEILDADIEINSQQIEFTTGDNVVRNDLQAVMTHEIGHFFGLAHSAVEGASMNPAYAKGDLEFRSISEDDRAGICEIYGPLASPTPAPAPAGSASATGNVSAADEDIYECASAEPRFGFSRYCGENVLADGCSIATLGNQDSLELSAALSTEAAPALRPEASPAAHQRAEALTRRRVKERREHLTPLLTLTVPLLAVVFGVWRRRRGAVQRAAASQP